MSVVSAEPVGEALVIKVDNPPVNACTHAVRHGLLNAIGWLRESSELKAAVIIGAGRNFIAGSDLNELGGQIVDPDLPTVIAAIEACDKPVIAAIHGAALGGGFELAMACDYRVAAADAYVGLPEITLGLIPGAGGTQRLPRMVGVARAIELICGAERVPAVQAKAAGLLDEVVEGDLLPAALTFLRRRSAAAKRRVRDQAVPPIDQARLDAAVSSVLRKGKLRPPVREAVAAVRSSATLAFDQALAADRARFHALRKGDDAESLRYLFYAERESTKRPWLRGVSPASVKTIGVVGAGTMGAGIAVAALDGGYCVVMVERNDEALARGREAIAKHYAAKVAAGKMKATTAAQCEARLLATIEWSALASAQLIIEAVFEDITAKTAVFDRLAKETPRGVVLATNTSYLDVDAIAAGNDRQRDVIGLHFFSPAQVMRLVEVVVGRESSPEAVATGVEVAKGMTKLPVLTGNAHGFVGNRIFKAYRRQCELIVQEGAYPEEVDAALEAFGMAMGPFAVADLSGLDIAWRMRQATGEDKRAQIRYPRFPDRLCEIGRFGRKAGAGYFDYDLNGKRSAFTSEAVRHIIDADSLESGLLRRPFDAREIQRRAVLAMVNEACFVLDERVAERPSDVDVVVVNGYGFPRWLGGPLYWARRLGVEGLRQELAWLSEVSGEGFLQGNVDALFA